MNELVTIEVDTVDGYADRIAACWRDSAEAIVAAGRLLVEARASLGAENYKTLVRDRLPFNKRTAERLVAIASDPRIAAATHVSLLPPSWGTIYELTRLDDATFQAKIKDGTICPDVERKQITALVVKRTADTRRAVAQILSDSSALSPAGRKFPVLYADPAWRRKAGIGNRAYENHYVTMTWADILAMPVAARLLPNAWGFVWMPRAHVLAPVECEIDTPLGRCTMKIPLAWAIQIKWGFDTYSTMMVWTKTDEEFPDDSGTGLIAWDQDEVLLLFKRGNGMPKPDTDKKYGSNHRERAGEHSAKPTFYRQMINDMTGGVPVLELFAREDEAHVLPPNFFTWGNQSKNTAETPGVAGRLIRENALTPAPAEALPEFEDIPACLRRNPDNSLPSVASASTETRNVTG